MLSGQWVACTLCHCIIKVKLKCYHCINLSGRPLQLGTVNVVLSVRMNTL